MNTRKDASLKKLNPFGIRQKFNLFYARLASCNLSVFSRYRNCVFVYSFSFEDITTSEISTTSDSNLSVTSDLQEELKSSLSIENEAPEEMEIDESLLSSNTSTLTSGQYFHFYKQLFF